MNEIERVINFAAMRGCGVISTQTARAELAELKKEKPLLCPGCGTPLEMQDSVWFCPGDPESCEFADNDWNAAERGGDAPTGRNVI